MKQNLRRPIFIIGCNRSGTTLLFRNLSEHPDLWSLYVEAQPTFHARFPVDEELGERVTGPADPADAAAIREDLFRQAHNKEAFLDRAALGRIPSKLVQRPLNRLYKPDSIRLIEKTPANSLRIPFLVEAFPEARFIFVVRRGEAVVSSLMEGWKLWNRVPPGGTWSYTKWHYLVPPGWGDYVDRPLEEICALQWIESNSHARTDLDRLAPDRYLLVRHEDLIADPQSNYGRIMEFCELRDSPYFRTVVQRANEKKYTTGGSAPKQEKWRSLHAEEIERVRERLEPVNRLYYE
jgi:hypothetical protein